ncbi:TPA: hypothetical protein ACGCQI_001922 [Legionella pneumophila]
MIMRYLEYNSLKLFAMLKSVRGRTADVLIGLFERIKDDAQPQGCGLPPRNTIYHCQLEVIKIYCAFSHISSQRNH